MKRVKINSSSPYEVIIGEGILHLIGSLVKPYKKIDKVVIISDSNVDGLYGDVVLSSFVSEGYSTIKYNILPSENSKNINTVENIINFLAENHVSKSDLIVSLGGGVVGDIVGFTASIYMRGISYIQVPTTILSSVDSSVGGKTGINIAMGKNMVGGIYQPLLVVCDISVFSTLTDSCIKDGFCEIVKYGLILDEDLLTLLNPKCNNFDISIRQKKEIMDFDYKKLEMSKIVSRCVELKAQIVMQDEFDTGIRHILNYGHTIGHAIEHLSKYKISHGNAVALGMYIVEKSMGNGFHNIVVDLLGTCGIDIVELMEIISEPSQNDFISKNEIVDKIKSDKKVNAGIVNFIVLEEVGKASFKTIPISELDMFIKF